MYESFLGILMGLGLAAACGFRVFVPVFVLAIAHRAGAVELGSGTAWLGSTPALVALGTATLLEVVAYWVPWLDHALDTVATPAAVVAGTLVAGSQLAEMGPFMRWGCALIAGGGVAATVQATTVVTRAGSTATTGGLANPVVATVESAGAAALSVVSVLAPIVAGVLLLAVLAVAVRTLWRWRSRRRLAAAAAAA